MNTNWKELVRSYSVWDDNNIKGFNGFKEEEFGWLSNFYKCDVRFNGRLFPSVENAYQAEKVTEEHRDNFINCSPVESKKLWKRYQLTDESKEGWNSRKRDVMLACVFDKFYRNGKLRQKLLNTGNKYLEETNHWGDVEWGVYNKTGEGKNILGKILMSVRNCFSIL